MPDAAPVPFLPPAVVERFGIRVLDPVSAVPLSTGQAPRPTAYLGDRLLVRGLPGGAREDLVKRIDELLSDLDIELLVEAGDD